MEINSEFEKIIRKLLVDQPGLNWLEISILACITVNDTKAPVVEALRQTLNFITSVEESCNVRWTEKNRLLDVLSQAEKDFEPTPLLLPETTPEAKVEETKVALFISTDKKEIFEGDRYYTFKDESKTDFHRTIATNKFDYNDGKERFSTEEAMREAVEVFRWLNKDRK